MKILIIILLIAASLRFYGLNWDQNHHLHPDERMITMVVTDIKFPETLEEWQNVLTPQSVLNPHFFAYGGLPIYLLKISGHLASFFNPLYGSYESINLVGRFISTLFDLGTILILYLLAKKLFNQKIALFSSFFYTISVLPIQLAHFYAVDSLLTFFILLTLYFLVKFHEHFSYKNSVLMGISFGLALSTKISAILLIVPIIFSFLLKISSPKSIIHYSLFIILILGSAIITTYICQPFMFIDFPSFLQQTLAQQAMTKDAFTFPYTLQYVGKIPYLYELQNIFYWGLGPVLAFLSFAGIIFFTFKTFRPIFNSKFFILSSFFWLYFLVTGSFAIGFMRYMLPLYPLLCLFASFFFDFLIQHLQFLFKNKNIINYTLYAILFTLLLIWPLSFLSIYSQPNTRTQASSWIQQNIPQGSTIAIEHWDDGLPLWDQSNYSINQLTLYDPETKFKWDKIISILNQTDYIIIASNRLYIPLMKLTDCTNLPLDKCYPQTANYYQKLFAESLGFRKVAEFSSYPSISFFNLTFTINDELADESFTVYDHPKVMIFMKNNNLD